MTTEDKNKFLESLAASWLGFPSLAQKYDENSRTVKVCDVRGLLDSAFAAGQKYHEPAEDEATPLGDAATPVRNLDDEHRRRFGKAFTRAGRAADLLKQQSNPQDPATTHQFTSHKESMDHKTSILDNLVGRINAGVPIHDVLDVAFEAGFEFAAVSLDPNYGRTKTATPGAMTLRDHFAIQAMNGMLAANGDSDGYLEFEPPTVAKNAYRMADAMLKARKAS